MLAGTGVIFTAGVAAFIVDFFRNPPVSPKAMDGGAADSVSA
jgi:hypothetical protein